MSHVPGEGSAGAFYTKFGFEYTGADVGGELAMRLALV